MVSFLIAGHTLEHTKKSYNKILIYKLKGVFNFLTNLESILRQCYVCIHSKVTHLQEMMSKRYNYMLEFFLNNDS